MKIFCVEYNTTSETGKPSVYMLPGTSMLNNNKPFYVPEFSPNVVAQAGFIFRLCKVGKYIQPAFAANYYDAYALGIQLTALDVYEQALKTNNPKDISRSFDGSFPISKFVTIDAQQPIEQLSFDLQLNDTSIAAGICGDLQYHVNELIVYLSQFFIMKLGDMIFLTASPFSDKLKVGDRLTLHANNQKVLQCKIK